MTSSLPFFLSIPSFFKTIDQEKIYVSFEAHRLNPEVTTDDYVRSCQIQLGKYVMDRERVYLDKRYWIILRDVVLARRGDQSSIDLLKALRARVHSNKSICPISETLFMELMKQQDLNTRKATAVLIDELSKGVTLIPHDKRIGTELAHFIHVHGQQRELHPLHDLVWSKLSYVFGIQHPSNTIFLENEERVFQKAFFDHMWNCSLSNMVELIGSNPPPSFDHEAVAQKLNEGNAKHAYEITNFPQAYKAEIRGSLRLFMPIARKVIESIYQRTTGQQVQTSEDEKRNYENQLYMLFCAAVEKSEGRVALRTLHIEALCHAAIRWDKKRPLTGNDLYDFQHAGAALAYCNIFLTEKPLKSLLQQKHLELTQDFPCKIISAIPEATEWAKVL